MLQILMTWVDQAEGERERDHTESSTKEDDGVADIVEIEILDGLGAEEDEEYDEDAAVETMIEVGESWSLHLDEADGGEGCCQHHEERHCRGDGGVLHSEDVPPEQVLQLTVLEPVSVKQPGEGDFAVTIHCLDTVIHVDTIRLLASSTQLI